MKNKTLVILLASTFLSSNVLAYKVDVDNWDSLNHVILQGNDPVISKDLTQWEHGNINLINLDNHNYPKKDWYGIYNEQQNAITLTGSSSDPARFLQWHDEENGGSGLGNITLSIRKIKKHCFCFKLKKSREKLFYKKFFPAFLKSREKLYNFESKTQQTPVLY